MSSAVTLFTEREYLALERVSERKHEFVDGAIVARAGARPAHNAITARLTALLVRLTEGRRCITLTSDQRIHVPATGLYAYPDLSVACGERRYAGDEPPSLLNPTIVVEVTSDTTEDFDRGKKFIHYQSIPELREYLVVSHRERRIDCFRREGDSWRLTPHVDGASLELPSLGGGFTVAEVYGDVSLDEGRR